MRDVCRPSRRLALLLAMLSGYPPAPAQEAARPDATKAQAEAGELLRRADEALKRGELAGARDLAKQANRAVAALPADDPLRTRAALGLDAVQWAIALDGGADRTALLWALDAARVAREAGDPDTARGWAAKAKDLAEHKLPENDPDRVRAALAVADVEESAALKAGDVRRALAEAEAAVKLAAGAKLWDEARRRGKSAVDLAARSSPPGDPARTRTALALGEIQWAIALDAKDLRTALLWADDAVQVALEGGDLDGARRWAARSAEAADRGLAPDDPDRVRADARPEEVEYAAALRAGELDRARGLADRVAARVDPLPAGDPARVRSRLARAGVAFAEVSLRKGDPAAALRLCDQAAEEAGPAPGPGAKARVEALLLAARLRLDLGDGGRLAAARLLADASRLLPADEPMAVAARAFAKATCWQRLFEAAVAGPAEQAEATLAEGLERLRRVMIEAGVDADLAAMGRLWLARFQWQGQRIEESAETLATLDAAARSPKLPDDLAADYWNQRGLVETSRANYALAGDCHGKALAIRHRARLPEEALSLNNLGVLLYRLGDFAAARARFQQAADYYASVPALKDDPIRPYVLTNLAKALEGEDDFRGADRLHAEALALAEAAPSRDRMAVCACRTNLGVNLCNFGEYDEAEKALTRARAESVAAFGAGHFHEAEIDVDLGWVALSRGQADRAESLFRAAEATFLAALGPDHPRTAEAMSYLARALAGRGKPAEARERIERALTIRERYLRRTLRSSLSERDRLAFVQELRVHPESRSWPGVLDTYLELGKALGIAPEERYRRVLAWKGSLAGSALPRADELEATPEVARLASAYEDALRRLRRAAFATRGGAAHPPLEEVEGQVEAIERELRQQSARFRRGGDEDAPTAAEVAAALPAGSALLDVIEARRYDRAEAAGTGIGLRYLAFLVRRDGLAEIDLGDARPINEAVAEFRAAIVQQKEDFARHSGDLASRIQGPIRGHLGGVSTLIVAGDDLLNFLPLAALPGERPGTFWAEELAFASVSSARSLLGRPARGRPEARGAVVVGGVDYGASTAPDAWAALAETRAEARDVARTFGRAHPGEAVTVLTGEAATGSAVLELMPRCRLVHLATHGFFREQGGADAFATLGAASQLDSGLVLAGANASREDARLTAEQVGRLDLRGTELITLSACESGLGHARAGQGAIGLFGSFDRAGAGAVVGSFWKVDDEATAALIASFYRHLYEGPRPPGPADALRAAQLDLIRGVATSKAGGPFRHPRYWAAFILAGHPEARRRDPE